jgi:predicted AlkP superfamily pyrophosphatase or phosphodiesterase
MNDGSLPARAQLRDEGTLSTVTTAFPSVTGPGYTPFLLGRDPGPVGLPGLRWFDRTRETARGFGNRRSYVGAEMRHVDADLDPSAPTLFELAGPAAGALSVIFRGLRRPDRIGRNLAFLARAAKVHFTGNVAGWLEIDRQVGAEVARHIREHSPRVMFAVLLGIDKASHATGHDSPDAWEAMRIVDSTAAEIRRDAERSGRWDSMHLWVASDHGHSPVTAHDDLAVLLRSWGHRSSLTRGLSPVDVTPR